MSGGDREKRGAVGAPGAAAPDVGPPFVMPASGWLDRLSSVRWWGLFAGVLAVLVALQVFYWTGPIASDDFSYFNAGQDPFRATASTSAQQVYARIAMWLPLRLSAEVLGRRWQALLPWPLIAANVGLVLVGLGALRWWGRGAALVAMAALGLVPQYVTLATVALPDTVGAMFGVAGLLLVAPALLDRGVGRAVGKCALGGLLIGLGYSAKEPAALLYPSLALFVLLWRGRCAWAWGRLAGVAVGGLIFLGGEAAVLWKITGDPLFHVNSIRVACRAYGSPVSAAPAGELIRYASDYLRWLADPRGAYGGWGPVYLAAVVLALWRRTDVRRLLLCCVLVGLAYLSVGTVDLTDYFPMNHQPRYLIPIMPMLALLVADVVTTLWRGGKLQQAGRSPRAGRPRWAGRLRRGGVVLVTIVLCAGSLVWPDRLAGRMYRARTFHAARMLVGQPDPPWDQGSRFVASQTTACRLSLLGGVDGVPPIEALDESPASAQRWQAQYGGCYVWVTKEDREKADAAETPEGVYLGTTSYEALRTFPRVQTATPPASRLNQVQSALGWAEPRYDYSAMVEVYHVSPPAGG